MIRGIRQRRRLIAIPAVVLALSQLPLAGPAQTVQPLLPSQSPGAAPLPGPTGGLRR